MMLPAPDEAPQTAKTPDYVPARMLNEFVYCPRLFFYEWVEGLFRESADTVEGKFQHRRVDSGAGALPEAGEIEEEELRTRSVTLSSDGYGVIAKMDLLEVSAGAVTPVDYKRGKPAEGDKGLEAWPSDRMQLAVQALVLRDNGYRCEEGLVYYGKTRQRVRVRFDEELMGETRRTIEQARGVAAGGKIPPALVDSPKCPRCSLAGICLPDETTVLTAAAPEPDTQLSLFAEEDRAPRAKPPASVRRAPSSWGSTGTTARARLAQALARAQNRFSRVGSGIRIFGIPLVFRGPANPWSLRSQYVRSPY
ncbi:MAG: CRISPR-associated protein Cas4 [bacterium]|nr:CRISPR-associated protein Cas4 [bacterium]